MAVNYVKFFRGTPNAFEKLAVKNNDTLYFISETDEAKGSLYLGSKLISGNISSINDLEDILIDDLLTKNQILAYDDEQEKWVNKSALDVIGLMIGATETAQGGIGLVPAPGIGQNDLFLRGDGVWAAPESSVQLKTDNKSISTLADGQTISLKNFGVQYYKYVAATDSEAAHYELQIVDSNNPWKVNLEPKVVEENGELVLGWFEPNPTTIDGVQDEIIELNNQIVSINSNINAINESLTNVYNKKETQDYVASEIAKVNHLTRKTFATIEEANAFILTEDHPENYIYMILASSDFWGENNKYDEYMYIDGKLEKVGAWETDLSDYVKKQEGYSLVADTEIAKLATVEEGAQKNFITAVDGHFTVVNGQLNLNDIPTSKITNLDDILKQQQSSLSSVKGDMTSLTSKVNTLASQVTNLNDLITNNYVSNETYNTDMTIIMDSIKWQDLSE